MATRVILHLLGYNCNLYAGIGDQLKTLIKLSFLKSRVSKLHHPSALLESCCMLILEKS